MNRESGSGLKYIDEYRDAGLGKRLVERIRRRITRPVRLMEFCGGHTVTIFKHGIRQLLSPVIEMLSGPGCPVCVTAANDLDKAIALSRLSGVIVATFGDMVRVPGSRSSLQQAKAEGGDVRIVYSAQDALNIARENPAKSVILIGIGFETTAPTIAASVLEAARDKIENYYVLSLHKLCPPVIKAILDSGEVKLDGIILPGHVSAVIGSSPYGFIPRDYGIACAVSGFEPLDVLQCVDMLVSQIEKGQPAVEVAYSRGVKPEGNRRAIEIMEQVFEVADAEWRGIGKVPRSGLALRKEFQRFDAGRAFQVDISPEKGPVGCICGDVLRGVKTPPECILFGQACRPEHPVGPCMVSSEGSCAAYYRYGDAGG